MKTKQAPLPPNPSKKFHHASTLAEGEHCTSSNSLDELIFVRQVVGGVVFIVDVAGRKQVVQ